MAPHAVQRLTPIASREVDATPGNLDLTDFSRTRARLLFEFEF